MLKNKLRYGLLFLVGAGWFLNWKYYFSRFQAEGFPDYLAFITGTALVIFSSIAFIMYRRLGAGTIERKLIFALWIALAFYSVNCTVAGQYWDQQIMDAQTIETTIDKENTGYLVGYYMDQIKKLDDEYDTIEAQKKETLKNLSDRYDYKRTLAAAEKRQEEIKAEKKIYEDDLKKEIQSNKVSVKNTEDVDILENIYSFYNSENPKGVQFIFQILLSIFIELIAPVSLYFFTILRPSLHIVSQIQDEKPKKEIEPKKEDTLPKATLRHFVSIAWYMIRSQKKDYLLNRDSVVKMASARNIKLSKYEYDTIIKKALEYKLIIRDQGRYKPASNIIDENYFYNKMLDII